MTFWKRFLFICLALALPSLAENLTFGEFGVQRPSGWSTETGAEQTLIRSPDKNAVVVIRTIPAGNPEQTWRIVVPKITESFSKLKYTTTPRQGNLGGLRSYITEGTAVARGKSIKWGLGYYPGSGSSLLLLYMVNNPAGNSYVPTVVGIFTSVTRGTKSVKSEAGPDQVVREFYLALERFDSSNKGLDKGAFERFLNTHRGKFSTEFWQQFMAARKKRPPQPHLDFNIFNNAQVGTGPCKVGTPQTRGSSAAVLVEIRTRFRGELGPPRTSTVELVRKDGKWKIMNIVHPNADVLDALRAINSGRYPD